MGIIILLICTAEYTSSQTGRLLDIFIMDPVFNDEVVHMYSYDDLLQNGFISQVSNETDSTVIKSAFPGVAVYGKVCGGWCVLGMIQIIPAGDNVISAELSSQVLLRTSHSPANMFMELICASNKAVPVRFNLCNFTRSERIRFMISNGDKTITSMVVKPRHMLKIAGSRQDKEVLIAGTDTPVEKAYGPDGLLPKACASLSINIGLESKQLLITTYFDSTSNPLTVPSMAIDTCDHFIPECSPAMPRSRPCWLGETESDCPTKATKARKPDFGSTRSCGLQTDGVDSGTPKAAVVQVSDKNVTKTNFGTTHFNALSESDVTIKFDIIALAMTEDLPRLARVDSGPDGQRMFHCPCRVHNMTSMSAALKSLECCIQGSIAKRHACTEVLKVMWDL